MREPAYQNHPGVAAVLSFVLSGLGQIYNGEIKKGLWLISLSVTGTVIVVLGVIILAGSFFYHILSPAWLFAGGAGIFFGGIVVCTVGLYSIFDAYKIAATSHAAGS